MFTLKPSPYEVASAENKDKMIKTLKKLRKTDDVDAEVDTIMKAIDKEKIRSEKYKSHIIKFMSTTYLKKTMVILIVFSFSHLSGINVITAFIVDIFSSTEISSFLLVLVQGVSAVFFSFFQMSIADKFGRRTSYVLQKLEIAYRI